MYVPTFFWQFGNSKSEKPNYVLYKQRRIEIYNMPVNYALNLIIFP